MQHIFIRSRAFHRAPIHEMVSFMASIWSTVVSFRVMEKCNQIMKVLLYFASCRMYFEKSVQKLVDFLDIKREDLV